MSDESKTVSFDAENTTNLQWFSAQMAERGGCCKYVDMNDEEFNRQLRVVHPDLHCIDVYPMVVVDEDDGLRVCGILPINVTSINWGVLRDNSTLHFVMAQRGRHLPDQYKLLEDMERFEQEVFSQACKRVWKDDFGCTQLIRDVCGEQMLCPQQLLYCLDGSQFDVQFVYDPHVISPALLAGCKPTRYFAT